MSKIVQLMIAYRGCPLGYIADRQHTPSRGYLAAWYCPVSERWREGHVYVDTLEEIYPLVTQAIDIDYAIQAEQLRLERRMTCNEIGEFLMSLRKAGT